MAKTKAQVQFEADTKGFNDGIKSADQQLVTLRKELKLNGTELKENADNTDLLTQRKEILEKEAEQVSKKIELLSSSLSEAEKLFGSNSKEVYQLNNKLLDAKNQYQSIQNETKQLSNSLDNLENSSKQSSQSIKDLESSSKKASDGFTIMKGAVADLVADGLSDLKTEISELVTGTEDATSKFQAATGASKEEMKAFKNEIESLYAENYGESMEDIADAMAEIKQQTGEINPSKLKELTKNSLALRDTFGFDIKESIRSVNMLMSQFGITSQEAFDLIVKGAQNGLDKNGDLLDTINEYSVHYKQLGFSSEEFFNSLINGASSGTFSVDKLGDAMKEFGIRSKDNSDSTKQAFKDLGLNATQITKAFGAGGEEAQKAFDKVLVGLNDMKDPVKQNQVGVALFGTMWEDLGFEAINSLSDVNNYLDDSKGSMNELNNVRYDNISSQISELGRIIKVDILGPVMKNLLPPLKSGINWLKNNLGTIAPILTTIGITLGTYFVVGKITSFLAVVKKLFISIKSGTAIMGALNTVMSLNPIGLIIAAVAGLITIFVLLWTKCEGFRNFFKGMWEGIKNVVSNVVNSIGNFFSGLWEKVKVTFDNIVTGIKLAFELIKNILVFAFQLITIPFRLIWETCKGIALAIWNVIGDKVLAVVNSIKDFIVNTFNKIKEFTSMIWNSIKEHIITPIQNVFNKVREIFESMKLKIQEIFNGIKEKASEIWNSIKERISGPITAAKDAVIGVVNNIKDSISNKFNSLKDKVATIFNSIKEKITAPFKAAKDTVVGFIDKIKSALSNLGVKIKLPHFKVKNWSLNPKDWVSKGMPKLTVDWYAKGAIFTKPTVFSTGNGLKGVGEAGAEGILPISNLQNWINSALSANNMYTIQANNDNFSRIEEKLDQIISKKYAFYMDKEKIAEATSEATDNISGLRYNLKERGLEL